MIQDSGKLAFLVTVTVAATVTTSCNFLDRAGELGEAPRLTDIQNPTARPGYRPVTMPMPQPKQVATAPNSLWRIGARAFFKDQRASDVGDIITVIIDIDDSAALNNETKRSRTNNENAAWPNYFGWERSIAPFFPEAYDPENLVNLESQMNSDGDGEIKRDEKIELEVAGLITQILPNGNLVLQGRQEVRVNFELRELEVAGVVRPEDITSDNTIKFEKMAEARIVYGGRGNVSDVQQPRWGQQVQDVWFPW
ncbi:MAG: flagellar basal body L-ring protein FlgH [Alphaproteobacteria bacterium]|nr:flagellar basal body L-ring protein FlgH [Alphaproteobacteria bacterium]